MQNSLLRHKCVYTKPPYSDKNPPTPFFKSP